MQQTLNLRHARLCPGPRPNPCPQHSKHQIRRVAASTGSSGEVGAASTREQIALQRARMYYEDVWSAGKVLKLNTIMAEDHQQHDMVWQPSRVGAGRSAMLRGVLAYRAAYPDLVFGVRDAAYSAEGHSVFVAWAAKGTNLGPIRDQPPTHKVTEFQGVSRLQFNEQNQIAASYVFRQAPADEARYFMGAAPPGAFASSLQQQDHQQQQPPTQTAQQTATQQQPQEQR